MKSLNFDTNDGVFEGEIMLYVYDKSHLEKLIKKWAPYNSIACLLLWESVENKIYFSA